MYTQYVLKETAYKKHNRELVDIQGQIRNKTCDWNSRKKHISCFKWSKSIKETFWSRTVLLY